MGRREARGRGSVDAAALPQLLGEAVARVLRGVSQGGVRLEITVRVVSSSATPPKPARAASSASKVSDRILSALREENVMTLGQLSQVLNIPRSKLGVTLTRLVRSGRVVRVSRGVYMLAEKGGKDAQACV